MLRNTVTHIVLLIALCFAQQYVVSRLAIFGAFPDIVTIYIVFAAVRHGQKQGTTYGFIAGLATGTLGGNLGIETLSKTIEGFVAGYFDIPEDSHASALQKKRRYYKAAFLASITGRTVYALMVNVLSLPIPWHIIYSVGLATLFTFIAAVLAYQLFFKKILVNN